MCIFATFILILFLLKIALGFSLKELATSVNGDWGRLTPLSEDRHCITLAIISTSALGDPSYPRRFSHQTLDGTIGQEALSSHRGA